MYGFGPTFSYKRWDFSFFLQGVAKVDLLISNIYPFGNNRRSVFTYIAKSHWTKKNKDYNAFYPRLSVPTVENNEQPTDYFLRNGSYLRLKRVVLGYSLNNIRFFAKGVNLFMFSPFKLWNPTVGGGNGLGYPPNRIFTFGININLTSNE